MSAPDLATLARQGAPELARLYAGGSPPTAEWLKERVAGRMLASGAPGLLERLTRPVFLAYSALGPFEGKSFNKDLSGGANRMLGHNRLPFRCQVVPSVLDSQATLRLSYDHPENPAVLRGLFDELRRIDDHLALGPAMVQLPLGKAPILFWFGLEI
ncbi:MAG: hypothetical protein IPG45_29845 [Deltaproteobacteria bacterium]|nr:hypothetical protein [Deltaproteobacteria bacterium]